MTSIEAVAAASISGIIIMNKFFDMFQFVMQILEFFFLVFKLTITLVLVVLHNSILQAL